MLRAAAVVSIFALTLSLIAGASAADQPPYEINAILSQTGPAAFLGTSVTKTLGIVENVVNREGGIKGRPVKFVISDDGSNPQVAVQLVTKLTEQKVPLIFGPGFVATCSASMPVTVKNGPLMYCLAPGIYPPAGSYVLASLSTTDDTTNVLIRYFRERGWKRLAVISSTDASGQSWDHGVSFAMAHAENKDVHIVAYEHMNPTDISVGAQLARIKGANPQAILTLATGTPWGTIMRGVADAGIDLPIGGGNGNMSFAQLGQYQSFLSRDLYFPGTAWIAQGSVGKGPIKEAQAVFFKAFKDAGIKPDLAYGIAYDPAMLVIHALQTLGPAASARQLRDFLVNLHGWVGINGIYDFRDGAQRGIGERALVIDRWDKNAGVFIAESRPGGYLK